MTRVKIGTSLDADLLKQAQDTASSTGKNLNEILEEALRVYLPTVNESNGADIVGQTWGKYKISKRLLKKILEEDVYDT